MMVTGNIDLAEEVPVPDLEPNVSHPYLQKDLTAMLGIEGEVYACFNLVFSS